MGYNFADNFIMLLLNCESSTRFQYKKTGITWVAQTILSTVQHATIILAIACCTAAQ